MISEKEKKEIEKMRSAYAEKETTPLEELKRKDRAARRPAAVFAYIFGITGALVLGVGMCLAMRVIGDLFILGIAVGIVGIAMVVANYFIYKAMRKAGRKKHAQEILDLSNKLLNE